VQAGDDCVNCGGEMRRVYAQLDQGTRYKCRNCRWSWTDHTDTDWGLV